MQAKKLEHDGRNISSGDISTKYYRNKKIRIILKILSNNSLLRNLQKKRKVALNSI
jgi:hypothetical protein